MHTINVNGREYTEVCGRVRAYGLGFLNAFAGANERGLGINEAYVYGTHGGDLSDTVNLATRIWSFAMGLDQIVGSVGVNGCPSDGGSAPPDFVGEDYFCEAPIEILGTNNLFDVFYHVLWDGENCGSYPW